jgi:cysteinyl-tRNA synthetase
MYREQFHRAVNDDVNIPAGLAVMWGMIDDSSFDAKKKLTLLITFDKVLGLGIASMKEKKVNMSAVVKKLAVERLMARKMKDWTRSDALRREIEEKGFAVEDGPEGQKILKKN